MQPRRRFVPPRTVTPEALLQPGVVLTMEPEIRPSGPSSTAPSFGDSYNLYSNGELVRIMMPHASYPSGIVSSECFNSDLSASTGKTTYSLKLSFNDITPPDGVAPDSSEHRAYIEAFEEILVKLNERIVELSVDILVQHHGKKLPLTVLAPLQQQRTASAIPATDATIAQRAVARAVASSMVKPAFVVKTTADDTKVIYLDMIGDPNRNTTVEYLDVIEDPQRKTKDKYISRTGPFAPFVQKTRSEVPKPFEGNVVVSPRLFVGQIISAKAKIWVIGVTKVLEATSSRHTDSAIAAALRAHASPVETAKIGRFIAAASSAVDPTTTSSAAAESNTRETAADAVDDGVGDGGGEDAAPPTRSGGFNRSARGKTSGTCGGCDDAPPPDVDFATLVAAADQPSLPSSSSAADNTTTPAAVAENAAATSGGASCKVGGGATQPPPPRKFNVRRTPAPATASASASAPPQ